MKTLKSTILLISVFLMILISCKKEPGFEGRNSISGTVTMKGKAVQNAIVYLAFDAKEATTEFDATTVTDAAGKYKFSALSPGDYFIDTDYTDNAEFKFESAGAKVTIGSKKDDITVDLMVE